MIELVLKWWAAGLQILDTMPPLLAAFLVGWAFSVGVAQPLKTFFLPIRWPEEHRELIVRVAAMLAAMLASGHYYARADGAEPQWLALVMIGTGLWSPLAYAMLIAFLRRGGRESFAADVLSGDRRGVLVAKLRGRP